MENDGGWVLARSHRVVPASKAMAVRLLDVLLPPRCVACQSLTAGTSALCAECWQDVTFICNPVCERLGTPLSHDMGEGGLSASAIANPPVFNRARAVALYKGVARDLVLALKFARRRDLAGPMGRWMSEAGRAFFDAVTLGEGASDPGTIVVPVPLHRFRLFARRFNQAADLARVIAREHAVTHLPLALQRVRRTRQQVGLDATARHKNVRGAFRLRPGYEHQVHGKNIVLVDDVLTTGSTVSACTRILQRAGAARVDVLCFAMAGAGDDVV